MWALDMKFYQGGLHVSASKKTYSVGRAWLAGVLVTLGVVLAPGAIVAHWATTEITNTQQFVETLSPLADDPAVQKLIVTEVTRVINEKVDISTATDSLLTGLGDALNLPKAAKDALGLVSGPVASGVKTLISNVVANVVASDAFQEAWTKALTLTQTQVVALLEGDPNSMLTLANDGTISLPLKPLIQDVKTALIAQGVSFASAIPEVDTTIVIAKVPELALARVIYQVGVGVGAWLPWLVLGFLVVGVLAANRRPRALFGASVSLAILMVIMALSFGTGRIVIAASIDPAYAGAAAVVYDAIVVYVMMIVAAIGTLALILGFTGWAFGESEAAGKLRASMNQGLNYLRGLLSKTSIPTDAASAVMHRWRSLVRVVIIALMGLGIAFANPLNAGAVVGFTILGLVLLGAYEVLQRPAMKPATATVVVAPTVSPAGTAARKAAAPRTTARATARTSTGTTTAKPAAKQAAKPAAKPSTKPAAKTATKPAAGSSEKKPTE
jgi:hypothetical protein